MNVTFILVNPAIPENVGAAARALKTMGFKDLRVVDSSAHLQEPARWLAHGAGDVLKAAKHYENFEAAVKDMDFVIATTAKKRIAKGDYIQVQKLASLIGSKGKTVQSVALVFGSEESGLSNEIIRKCDIASSVPMQTNFPSLNLAQAVMVYAWELSFKGGIIPAKSNDAAKFNYPKYKKRLLKLLAERAIDQNINLKNRILERSAQLSADDINLVLSVLQKLE